MPGSHFILHTPLDRRSLPWPILIKLSRFAYLVLVLTLAIPLGAQPSRPRVLVIATGGTISNLSDSARLTGEDLVKAIPRLDSVARITVEQFSNVASGSITTEQWVALARRINGLFRSRDSVHGVVVTHGTDTMEETAYFLDLTVDSCHPVVVTGAMRNPATIAPDGPANLYNAVRVAASGHAKGRGVMVLLNDEIFAARDVAKTNTVRLNAFTAPGRGPVGTVDGGDIVFSRPARDSCAPAFALSGEVSLPRVDIIYSYAGADSVLIDAAVAAGAKGLVMASVGRGGTTPGQRRALARAMQRGVFAVASSRTGSGRVPALDSAEVRNWKPGMGALLGAEDLNPQKARVLLMLALTRSRTPAEIAETFRKF